MENPHNDILKAEIPLEEDKKVRLLDELKSRAKGAFQAKDLLNAEMLYSKAIDCSESGLDAKTHSVHLLYSNRAAVRLLLQRNEGALGDCESCLKLDNNFIKAHFRKAQALFRLQKFKTAIDACKIALELHPGNSEIKNLQLEIQRDWDKDEEQKRKFNEEANEIRPDLPKPEPTRIPMSAPAKKQKATGDGDSTAESTSSSCSPKDEQGNTSTSNNSPKDEKNTEFRGYKKTADGKTTSYFHTEISAEAKALIGDCKPQRILDPAKTEAGTNQAVGSAWNQAGTFEERNYTKWFHEKIRERFPNDTEVSLPNDLPDVSLSLDKINGDANITCARGKVKYIHDISCVFNWKFETADGKAANGTLKLESDGDGDWDETVEVDQKTHSQTRSIVSEFVKSTSKGVQPFALGKLRGIEKEFQSIKI